ncbi:uncharacterized protein F5Z01DRAFT_669948 [Emericellopsis atlantica]|uniref:Uncharacterized protein n=1 Tax=Emericellopsis atlantica TaxID=2614577 RepID=A0A9P8CTJ2_9HYPO|nr:uncharacterized protein F5Z01DRAFT_669948 [Emericellopsis atlantica]KAG9259229.1 hypothetical protein F5Z01DRAFT_669948 [Emericellopsis atlantica]
MTSTKAKDVVVDSWDDEEIASEDEKDTQSNALQPTNTNTSSSSSLSRPAVPGTPPPTPITPTTLDQGSAGPGMSFASRREAPPERRPEKTDAVARRMIAAGLGLKAPKQTDEQKEYQKSVREQEKRRREEARREEARKKEEAEKAKAAIWDD